MTFRQSGQSDDRRRRLLREDRDGAATDDRSAADAETARDAAKEAAPRRSERRKTSKRRAYTAAALVEGQLRLIDLIPVRAYTLSVLVLLTLSAISALNVLYQQWPGWDRALGGGRLEFMDLTARDSLAGWFSAMLLAFAACQCLFIYCLRRYKADDYRGRYRIWLAAAAIFMLASADSVAGWGLALAGLATKIPAIGESVSTHAAWRIGWALVFTVGAGRMLFEMRRSLSSVASLLLGAASYCAALVLLAPALDMHSAELSTLARTSCRLLGHAAMLFTLLFYARRVFLEAHGHIAVPKSKSSAKGKRKAAKKASAAKAAPDDARKDDSQRKEEKKVEVVKPAPAPAPAAAKTGPAPASAESAKPAKTASAPEPAKSAMASAPKLSPLARLLGKSKPAPEGESAKPAPKSSAPAAAAKPAATPVFKTVADADDDDDDDESESEAGSSSKLSKAERRRLRKEQRRDRRAA
jgi:hypothetical protein